MDINQDHPNENEGGQAELSTQNSLNKGVSTSVCCKGSQSEAEDWEHFRREIQIYSNCLYRKEGGRSETPFEFSFFFFFFFSDWS